ncbi:MAG TPA: polyketide synthase, partial [Saliniramus sp.]|nr:polyketide synthase [Saliniramus sp.]
MLRRTMAAMDALRERLERKIAAEREPIAVVGLGCRFPGIEGPEEFAQFLKTGESLVGRLTEARAAAFAGPRAARYQAGGFFEDIAAFDADAFGIAEDEALAMDPHLRFLLEVARDAIEDAALADGRLSRSRTAVILALGAQNNDYAAALAASPAGLGRHAIPGSFHSLMPGRLSYHFDLRGPSFVVDAACASSLVAVDLACQSLRRGDCDYALVAAVNLVLSD